MGSVAVWLNEIQRGISRIRSWPEWSLYPLDVMRSDFGTEKQSDVALLSYQSYVRRFTIIMCSVMAKAPEADSRFWRLAVNLYDELGERNGLDLAHGKLLEKIKESKWIEQPEAEDFVARIAPLENDMFTLISGSEWALSLFALGPGTESISDLFLEPLEHWAAKTIESNISVQQYFELHYPSVEHEHQLEISRILAEELDALPENEGIATFSKGMKLAESIARIHLRATVQCWQNSIRARSPKDALCP